MTRIDLTELDANLADDLAGDTSTGWELYEAEYAGATVSNQHYQILFNRDLGRGGIVFLGSGSSGATGWTDAASPDEVLERHLADDMRA